MNLHSPAIVFVASASASHYFRESIYPALASLFTRLPSQSQGWICSLQPAHYSRCEADVLGMKIRHSTAWGIGARSVCSQSPMAKLVPLNICTEPRTQVDRFIARFDDKIHDNLLMTTDSSTYSFFSGLHIENV